MSTWLLLSHNHGPRQCFKTTGNTRGRARGLNVISYLYVELDSQTKYQIPIYNQPIWELLLETLDRCPQLGAKDEQIVKKTDYFQKSVTGQTHFQ